MKGTARLSTGRRVTDREADEIIYMKDAWSTAKPWIIPGLLCLLFFLNGLNDAVQNSAVADEVGGHLASGYLYWLSGEYTGGIANFPLAHLLIALPVVLLGYSYELFTEQHLVLFRLPVLLLGLLLGIVVYRFTAQVFCRKAALAALFLFSMAPNTLAHASLATLDLPITFFIFLTIYALWRYVQQPHWGRMLALSLALACALTTKVQAILLIPIVLLVLAIPPARPAPPTKHDSTPNWSWICLLLVPWLWVNIIYLNVPFLSGDVLPPIFTAALEKKLLHATGPAGRHQVAYLCGRYSPEGWWYYFPFAILVKTPLPTLILLALGLARRHTRQGLFFVVLPAVVFLGVAMTSKLNIGLRHVLVVDPFLFMLAGEGAARLWGRSWRGLALITLAAAYVWQAAMIAPHHLSYFNIAAGGPRNGHKLLIGSNYDSGQNDHFLRRYIEDQGIAYQINPDPFRPTTGHIMVKANAFYGSYGGGGPAAYAWLRHFEPIRQIAYTWFEYNIPKDAELDGEKISGQTYTPGLQHPFRPWNENVAPGQLDAALKQIERHVQDLRLRYRDVRDPLFRLSLGWAFVATAAYEDCLGEMRLLLEEHPGFGPALGLGGELMVRWKVGNLRFKGDQYLTGVRPNAVTDHEPLPDIPSVARAAGRVGISKQISRVHFAIAVSLHRQGKFDMAVKQYQAALKIDPSNTEARKGLQGVPPNLLTPANHTGPGHDHAGHPATGACQSVCCRSPDNRAHQACPIHDRYQHSG